VPNLPLEEIREVRVTRLANQSHGNSVAVRQENAGEQPNYHLVRQRLTNDTNTNTDVAAIEQGNISITPLHTHLFNRHSTPITDGLFSGLLQELQGF